MTADDRQSLVKAIVVANRYMTIATADENGLPWASPVWYATADYREFFWSRLRGPGTNGFRSTSRERGADRSDGWMHHGELGAREVAVPAQLVAAGA